MPLLILDSFSGVGKLVLVLILVGNVLWVLALIDILRGKFRNKNDRLIWALVVLFGNFVGAILYFFIGRTQKIK